MILIREFILWLARSIFSSSVISICFTSSPLHGASWLQTVCPYRPWFEAISWIVLIYIMSTTLCMSVRIVVSEINYFLGIILIPGIRGKTINKIKTCTAKSMFVTVIYFFPKRLSNYMTLHGVYVPLCISTLHFAIHSEANKERRSKGWTKFFREEMMRE
jgi:hypothetical protein